MWNIIQNVSTQEVSLLPFGEEIPEDHLVLASTANPHTLETDTTVPAYVTMRQARLALLQAEKLNLVPAIINSLPSPIREAANIEWEYSSEVQRYNGFVSQIGPALGMTSADIDALFILAKGL